MAFASIRLVWLCALSWFCCASIALAQGKDALIVPWTEWPGSYELDGQGQLTGFYAELARLVASEAGYEVVFVEYETPQAALAAQRTGVTDILAGVSEIPLLDTNEFSSPIGQTAVYLFVREEAGASSDMDDMIGQRIGVIAGTSGSEYGDLDGRAGRVVEFANARAAFGALILGDVSGVVTTFKLATDLLKQTRLDYRVKTLEPELASQAIHVAISPNSIVDVDDINSAINRLSQKGILEDLLRRWNVHPPEPAGDVLTVGVAHFPPYQVVAEDGRFTGFGVEALREIANRAAIEVVFKEISREEWVRGPRSGNYDILPPLSVTKDRAVKMMFTDPLQESPYSIFVRAGEDRSVGSLADLKGLNVGFVKTNWAAQFVHEMGGVVQFAYDADIDLLDALLNGEVDAALYATETFRRLLEREDALAGVRQVDPPFAVSQRAIALRDGLALVRERMDAVIPGYLSSDEYQRLSAEWLTEPKFWTQKRVYWLIFGSILTVSSLLIFFIVFVWRSRARAIRVSRKMEDLTRRYSAILNTASCGILAVTKKGEIMQANKSAAQLLAFEEAARIEDMPWPDNVLFLDPKDHSILDQSSNPVNRARSGAILRSEKAVMKIGDTDEFLYVNISSTPVMSPSQPEISAVVILDDITNQEISRINEQRVSRFDALGQLSGGIAHDFNNILGTIDYANSLASKSANQDQISYLNIVSQAVSRGSALTNRLLTFAKEKVGVVQDVSIANLFAELKALVLPTVEASIEVTFEVSPEEFFVLCDPSQIENVVLNLCINSRNAIIESGLGGHIRVGADFDGACAVIFVEDDGPGMDRSVLSRASDPFFTTRKNAGGTGLGLAMARGFAESAGGEFSLTSTPGEGTRVEIKLPAVRKSVETTISEETAVTYGNGETVLVVEDQDILREVTSIVIEGLGYEVVCAESGEAALEMVVEGLQFDLLITDIVMPGSIGGYELAVEVRQRRPTVPVLYMSGYSGSDNTEYPMLGERLGKPCSPAELSGAMARALRGGKLSPTDFH